MTSAINSVPNDAPLAGVRVIEFGQYIAVPAAGQSLADLGAEVIKIEPSAGDAARQLGWTDDDCGPMFTAYNRGKRSVVLDLRSDAGSAAALKLVASADIVLQNMRPGAMHKLGLSAEQLMSQFPRLIYGQVSGFGQRGPASLRAGLDIAAQAESGMMSLNGEAGRDPVRVGFTAVDILTAQSLTSGVLAALFRRSVNGCGALINLSLIDIAVASLANAWAEYRMFNKVPLRRGNGQPTVAPAAEVVATSDGMVVVSAYTEEHFPRLCNAIGSPELAQDARFATNRARVENRAALLAALNTAFNHHSTHAVCELLSNAGVVVGAIRTMDQIRAGQEGVSKDLFVGAQAGERAPADIPGVVLIDDYKHRPGRVPSLGEHTRQVLSELNQAN